jgi:hypothetical protein
VKDHLNELLGIEPQAHDVVVILLPPNVELASAQLVEAEVFVEADGRLILCVDAKKKALGACITGMSDCG